MNEIKIDNENWYTYQQLAKLLNKSVRTIYLWRDSNIVETMKIDKYTFYRMKGGANNG